MRIESVEKTYMREGKLSFMRVGQNPDFGLLHPVAPAKMAILQATP